LPNREFADDFTQNNIPIPHFRKVLAKEVPQPFRICFKVSEICHHQDKPTAKLKGKKAKNSFRIISLFL
jgi:hypothetical protein